MLLRAALQQVRCTCLVAAPQNCVEGIDVDAPSLLVCNQTQSRIILGLSGCLLARCCLSCLLFLFACVGVSGGAVHGRVTSQFCNGLFNAHQHTAPGLDGAFLDAALFVSPLLAMPPGPTLRRAARCLLVACLQYECVRQPLCFQGWLWAAAAQLAARHCYQHGSWFVMLSPTAHVCHSLCLSARSLSALARTHLAHARHPPSYCSLFFSFAADALYAASNRWPVHRVLQSGGADRQLSWVG